ncbi:MAG: hypothetical protein V4596_07915 [Bdellovibrionota bacterium]
MIKKNIYVGITITMASVLILFFQNCGQSKSGQAPVAEGGIVIDDFLIVDSDCSLESTCKVTVAKTETSSAAEGDLSNKLSVTDEEIPNEFYKHDVETSAYQKCVFVNRRDDIRFEYLCSK